jgi:two-component system, chemotaxis family, protein-glutamate methylesterase/glutaminase
MIHEPFNVLVVDDSAVFRGLLSRVIESAPGLHVSATAADGRAALEQIGRRRPDAVVLDLEMPVLDGLDTLREMQREHSRLPVVVVSALTQRGAGMTMQALSLGAVACVSKPTTAQAADGVKVIAHELIPLMLALAERVSPQRTAARVPELPLPPRSPAPATAPRVLVIGASTGGPQALRAVISGLPAAFDLPILIVQHMPPVFTTMLAEHLGKDSGRPCAEARDGEPIQRGHIYVAPGDWHLEIRESGGRPVTRLTQAAPEHFCRPSVNPLFRSAAQRYGSSTLAVMLTGMGSDGLEGSRSLIQTGGTLLAQDEATSVVWGMPGAVAREKLAHAVLPLNEIACMVCRLSSVPEVV